MPWLSVDKNKREEISLLKPERINERWWQFAQLVLPSGSIERLIGRKLDWESEPVELTEQTLAKPVEVTDEEIKKEAEDNWDVINFQFKGGLNPYAHKIGFIEGARWMRERMKR